MMAMSEPPSFSLLRSALAPQVAAALRRVSWRLRSWSLMPTMPV
jgi:hypothetical protein